MDKSTNQRISHNEFIHKNKMKSNYLMIVDTAMKLSASTKCTICAMCAALIGPISIKFEFQSLVLQ